MIKIFFASEKTNSYRPEPWAWSTEPFPAFRGAGQRYNAFLAVANGFTPWFSTFNLADNKAMSDDFCKIIKTKKGTNLLAPCRKEEDEKVLLITARGAFRGSMSVKAVGAEILWQNGMAMHCCPVEHIVARIIEPDGYIVTETGDRNRSSSGCTEIYSWKGGYFELPTAEYEAAVELGNLFASHDTIQSDLEQCKTKRKEQALSRDNRVKYYSRLERVNATLKACNVPGYDLSDNTFFTEGTVRSGKVIHHLYTDDEARKAEAKAAEAKKDAAQREAHDFWKPRFTEATKGYTFTEGKTPWGDSMPQYYTNCISVWSTRKDKYVHYNYSEVDFDQFVRDLPQYEEEYQDKQRAKAKAEAERIAKEKAEETERLAREAAAERQAQAEVEAREAGLPSNIRIWHRNGRTDAGKGWVIGQNGRERECDFVDTMVCGSNSKKYHQKYEGDHIWNQILPGELVIQWSKSCTAAEHVCEVLHRPETISEAQLEHVAEIQQELEAEWEGLAGLTSGVGSPSIGEGWLGQLAV